MYISMKRGTEIVAFRWRIQTLAGYCMLVSDYCVHFEPKYFSIYLYKIFFLSFMQYKYCAEGCCPHEFCAYHKICYPVIHCEPTCPDGSCQNGLCFPAKPCKVNTECGFAESCSYNFNLGYETCQYNLNIGDTLCYDRNGKSVYNPKPDESPFVHNSFNNRRDNL